MGPCIVRIFSYTCMFLASRPTTRLEDQTLSAVRDCLFNISAATLHTGGPSSNHNLKKRHDVVRGTIYNGSIPVTRLKMYSCFNDLSNVSPVIYWSQYLVMNRATNYEAISSLWGTHILLRTMLYTAPIMFCLQRHALTATRCGPSRPSLVYEYNNARRGLKWTKHKQSVGYNKLTKILKFKIV